MTVRYTQAHMIRSNIKPKLRHGGMVKLCICTFRWCRTLVVFRVRFRALYKRLKFVSFRPLLCKRRQAAIAVVFCINIRLQCL